MVVIDKLSYLIINKKGFLIVVLLGKVMKFDDFSLNVGFKVYNRLK